MPIHHSIYKNPPDGVPYKASYEPSDLANSPYVLSIWITCVYIFIYVKAKAYECTIQRATASFSNNKKRRRATPTLERKLA